MKKIATLTLALFAFILTTQAQGLNESEVPAKVKEAFAKNYPGNTAKWEHEGSDFEAEFTMDKLESSAIFDQEGNFKALEQEMNSGDLPKAITEYCSKNYPTHRLAEAAKITFADKKVRYEAEMRKGRAHFDLLFDEKGGFISKENGENQIDED